MIKFYSILVSNIIINILDLPAWYLYRLQTDIMIKNSIGVYPTRDDIQVYLRSSTVFVNLQNRKGE